MKKVMICLLYFSCFLFPATNLFGAWYDNAEWYDQYYQYRVPVEVSPTSTGLQILNVASDTIVDAVNLLEEIHHSDWMFDYNRVKVVEYDGSGQILDVDDSAGFYLSYAGSEMVTNGTFESESGGVASSWTWNYIGSFLVVSGQSHNGSKCLRVETETSDRNRITQGLGSISANTFYILSYWLKGTQNSGGTGVGLSDTADPWNKFVNGKSYMPTLAHIPWTQYDMIFREATSISIQANIERNMTGTAYIDDVSVRQARIDLLVNPDSTGAKKYMIYYQPAQSASAVVPEKRITTAPATVANPSSIGSAQRYDSIVKYVVSTGSNFDIWFAETTQKITPAMGLPAQSKSTVSIESAVNERQSFQLVFKAKANLVLDTATLGALTTGSDTIPADKSYTKILSYVSMAQQSPNAHNLIPRMADMLEAFDSQTMTAASENLALWFTVIADSIVDPGIYSGNVTLEGTVGGPPFTEKIPVSLKVHKFALPDEVTFRTSHGGQHFAATYGGGNIYDFHGVTSSLDKDTLVLAYYDEMCANKVFPFGVNYGVGYSYLWDAPPGGYNVDAPGNYFYLHDFDFSSYNSRLSYFVDTHHVNSFTVAHTNGGLITQFGLTGLRVAWDDPGAGITDITMLQFDNLIADYWREVAYNLILNGWIDKAYYSIDESPVSTYPHIRHVIDVLAADMFASYIKIQWDIDKTSAFSWREHDTETDVTFKDRVAIWAPENNENYSFYHDYYFTERNMDPAVEENWCYYTKSAHLNIDTHGLNNRVLPMKNFFMHSNGFLQWASFIYEAPAYGGMQNPRIDPYSSWGNGCVAYFYPPGDTIPTSLDLTITPSARLETFREGIEDYEYMVILDNWIDTAGGGGIDTSTAAFLREEMHRMFNHPVRWSVNDEYYLLVRKQILSEIDKLMWYSTYGQPSTEISSIVRAGSDIDISLYATDIYRYNLLRSSDLVTPSWVVVDTMLVSSGDTVTLTDTSVGGAQKAFYKVEAVIP